jgi:HlyD family secretion protein
MTTMPPAADRLDRTRAAIGTLVTAPASRPRRSVVRWLASAMVMGAALFVVTRLQLDWARAESGSRTGDRPAAVGPPATATPSDDIILDGYVFAEQIATVSADVVGKLDQLLVAAGDRVTTGQLIAKLNPEMAEARLRVTEARRGAAEAELHRSTLTQLEARQAVGRGRSLRTAGLLSEEQWEALNHRAQATDLQVQAAERELDGAVGQLAAERLAVEQYSVRAPFDGIITSINARPGEVIAPGSYGGGFTRSGIVTLYNPATLGVRAEMPEELLPRVQRGQRADVSVPAAGDVTFGAVVEQLPLTADHVRRVVTLELTLDRAAGVIPDLAVKIRLHPRTGNTP